MHALPTALILALAAIAAAAPNRLRPIQPEALDHKTLHDQYNEGDFESVINSIEGFMKRNKAYPHEDSVFIAKHLAVVYTANPATREKGKYYMHRLLELLPSAKLVDMYVSEEIDRIFDKVREEFLARQRAFGVDPARMAVPDQAPATGKGTKDPVGEAPKGKQGHAGFWIAGGTALVAAGLTAAYLVHQGEEQPDYTFRVPRR